MDASEQAEPADEGRLERMVGRPVPKRYVGGRIVGGCSLHAAHEPNRCQPYHHRCPEPRVVDCCGVVDEHDIVECSHCGKQWTVPCNFDEDYS